MAWIAVKRTSFIWIVCLIALWVHVSNPRIQTIHSPAPAMKSFPKLSKPATTLPLKALLLSPLFRIDELRRNHQQSILAYIKPPEPSLHHQLFHKTDAEISQTYRDTFWYHDLTLKSRRLSWNREFFTPGSLDFYGRARTEEDIRSEWATRVLRERINAGITGIVRMLKPHKDVAAAHRTLSKIQQLTHVTEHVPIALTKKKDSPELVLGYDVRSGSGKLEYLKGAIEIGVYHPSLLPLLEAPLPGPKSLQFRARTNFSSVLPTAEIAYTTLNSALDTRLSKALSSTISADISGSIELTKPIKDTGRIGVGLSYQF